MIVLRKAASSVAFILIILNLAKADNVCNLHCDGRDSSLALETRVAVTADLFFRKFSLFVSDRDNMAYGRVENGDPNDEIWMDRSFDGGKTWAQDSRLGDKVIPEGAKETETLMYNIDNPSGHDIGALRVCGKAWDRDEIACTAWARSTVNAENDIDATATALMQYFAKNGLFEENGWWTGANALTEIIDYSRLTGSTFYHYAIDQSFELNKDKEYGNFTNFFVDDTLWWGLAWVGAYDLLGDQKYLEMAKVDADFAYSYKDDVCGGGIYWTVDRASKNAIQNELFIKLAAALHNRIPGDTKYLNQAKEVWDWFYATGYINGEGLINDGIRLEDCKNNGDITWTYNQGVISGGLVELYKATGDATYLNQARSIFDAVIRSSLLTSTEGVLTEPCEGWGDCGADGPSFKGATMRNFGELNRVLGDRPYSTYMQNQVNALSNPSSYNSLHQYGLSYAGPFDGKPGHGKQHSALSAFNAAL